MDWINLLIVASGALALAVAAWAFIRGGAQSEKARNRAVRARLEALGKVSQFRRMR